ncbi:hypothetical protein JG688_00014155 [Phytophthora aleatoria]|uniref:Fibronectin type-III domain-containing protein n=1 Tax=Phytophthora aleatoria TaxID=2496075 RepID=A0A8J5ME45_9STRA|nr:hypothetical protein JG688_00014155 [Phytophthora aleatoria]
MAYNADGFGSATSPLASAVTCWQPQPPQSVVASVVDGTTLAVSWSAVEEACSVDKYKVEWYRAEGTQEQQTITTSAGKGLPEVQKLVNFADSRTLTGYFKLSFGGEVTENLRWDAEATGLNSVKERLERLSSIGTVDVSREESTRVTGLFVTVTGKTVMRHTLSTATVVDSKLAKDDVIWIAEWTNPLFDGGSSLKSYHVEWDEQEDFSSGQTSSATIPIVREMQSVVLQSQVVNEEQFVDVTVEVVNEQQEVRSTFTGLDEIQVIKTTNDIVKDEVQKVVTSAADGNEIQELHLDDDDIDEIQAIHASEEFGYGYVFQITFIGNNVAGETKKIDCADKTFVTTGNVPSSCGVTMDTDIAMGTDTAVEQVIVTAKKPLVAGIMDITLEAMDNIDKVYVTRQRDGIIAPNGFIYRIFFHGNGVNGDVNKLDFVMCTDFQTQEKNALTTVGVDGQVLISMVDYGGFNPLNTFSLVDEQGGYIWTVAFKDSEGNLPQFICAVDSIFESAAGAGCETDTLTDGNVLSGSFLIEASSPIPFNADAGTMKAALEAMAWVGTVQVKQSAASSQRGYTWTITFLDYRGDVPTLLVTKLGDCSN